MNPNKKTRKQNFDKIKTFYLKNNTGTRPFLIQSFDYSCLKQFVTRLYRVTDGVAIQLSTLFLRKIKSSFGTGASGAIFVKTRQLYEIFCF